MNTQIFIVTGLPGSGKSTLAEALAKEFKAEYLNTDRIRTEIGLRGQYGPAAKEAIYIIMMQEADSCLAMNQNLVLDGTFYMHKHREAFNKLAQKWQIEPLWIEVEAEESIIKERMSKKREFSEANFEVYREIKAIWEPIVINHISLRSDHSTTKKMIEAVSEALMEKA